MGRTRWRWRSGMEQWGVFASLRVWRTGEDEATQAVLLSDVLEAAEREAATSFFTGEHWLSLKA